MILLLVLRFVDRPLYDRYIHGLSGAEDVQKRFGGLENADSRQPDFSGTLAGYLRAHLYGFSQLSGERENRTALIASSLQGKQEKSIQTWEADEATEHEELERLKHAAKELPLVVKRIELARRFV